MQEGNRTTTMQNDNEAQVRENTSQLMIDKEPYRSEAVTNMYGNQFLIKEGAKLMPKHNAPETAQYSPKLWERVVALSAALLWFGLVGFLVIRNQALEPNFVVLVRIILSVMAGILGAMIPGILLVGIHGPGFKIRAGGALALFVISYFFTPAVIQ